MHNFHANVKLIKHRNSLASKLTCKTQLVFVVWGRINVMAEKQCDGEADVTKSTNGSDALFFSTIYLQEKDKRYCELDVPIKLVLCCMNNVTILITSPYYRSDGALFRREPDVSAKNSFGTLCRNIRFCNRGRALMYKSDPPQFCHYNCNFANI